MLAGVACWSCFTGSESTSNCSVCGAVMCRVLGACEAVALGASAERQGHPDVPMVHLRRDNRNVMAADKIAAPGPGFVKGGTTGAKWSCVPERTRRHRFLHPHLLGVSQCSGQGPGQRAAVRVSRAALGRENSTAAQSFSETATSQADWQSRE